MSIAAKDYNSFCDYIFHEEMLLLRGHLGKAFQLLLVITLIRKICTPTNFDINLFLSSYRTGKVEVMRLTLVIYIPLVY